MLVDPIAIALALFVALGLVVPNPVDWRRHPPAPDHGPGP
jgi:hypothetical protein